VVDFRKLDPQPWYVHVYRDEDGSEHVNDFETQGVKSLASG
jgi:hypothetical protein